MTFIENITFLTLIDVLLVHSVGRFYNNLLDIEIIKKWEIFIIFSFICIIFIKKTGFNFYSQKF